MMPNINLARDLHKTQWNAATRRKTVPSPHAMARPGKLPGRPLVRTTYFYPLVVAVALAVLGVAAWPTDPEDPKEPASSLARMDTQLKAMQDMHAKMTNAKTRDELKALMAEHAKTMRDGISLMESMGTTGQDAQGSASYDIATRHQLMEKRMAMMEVMMQMMVDRMSADLKQ